MSALPQKADIVRRGLGGGRTKVAARKRWSRPPRSIGRGDRAPAEDHIRRDARFRRSRQSLEGYRFLSSRVPILRLFIYQNLKIGVVSSSNDQQTCGTKGASFQGWKGLVWLRARGLHGKKPFGDGSDDRSSKLRRYPP